MLSSKEIEKVELAVKQASYLIELLKAEGKRTQILDKAVKGWQLELDTTKQQEQQLWEE